jgi:hypothetical protein
VQAVPAPTSANQVAIPLVTSPPVTTSSLVDFNNTVNVTDSVDSNRGAHYNSQPAISGVAPLTVRVKVPSGNDASLVYGDGTDSSTLKQGLFSRETGYSVARQKLEHTYTKPGTYVIKYFALMPSGLQVDVTIYVKENTSAVKDEVKVSALASQSDKTTTYTNQTYGYTVNYPKNWLVEPETQELRKPMLKSLLKIKKEECL